MDQNFPTELGFSVANTPQGVYTPPEGFYWDCYSQMFAFSPRNLIPQDG